MATENSTQKTDSDRNSWPYFATAGNPAQFFNVAESISNKAALEGASMFLATAASLGNTPEALDDDARWAIVHLVEMAKVLVESVLSASMTQRP